MASAEALLDDACSDQISDLSQTQLWVVIAEALAQQVSMTAEELLDAACEDGIATLSENQLLVAIAEGINQGGGGGGGGTIQVYQDHTGSPPGDPTKPALSFPNGGGQISQWNVATQEWL